MFKNKPLLWLLPILAGIALGIFIYSYIVWNTKYPSIFLGYWFGIENLSLVFGMTAVISLAYFAFVIIGIIKSELVNALKLWMILGMIIITGITTFSLSFSQRFQEENRLNIDYGPAQSFDDYEQGW